MIVNQTALDSGLFNAVRDGDSQTVKAKIEAGANLTYIPELGLLSIAIQKPGIIQLLLPAIEKLGKQNEELQNALPGLWTTAIRYGREEELRFLYDNDLINEAAGRSILKRAELGDEWKSEALQEALRRNEELQKPICVARLEAESFAQISPIDALKAKFDLDVNINEARTHINTFLISVLEGQSEFATGQDPIDYSEISERITEAGNFFKGKRNASHQEVFVNAVVKHLNDLYSDSNHLETVHIIANLPDCLISEEMLRLFDKIVLANGASEIAFQAWHFKSTKILLRLMEDENLDAQIVPELLSKESSLDNETKKELLEYIKYNEILNIAAFSQLVEDKDFNLALELLSKHTILPSKAATNKVFVGAVTKLLSNVLELDEFSKNSLEIINEFLKHGDSSVRSHLGYVRKWPINDQLTAILITSNRVGWEAVVNSAQHQTGAITNSESLMAIAFPLVSQDDQWLSEIVSKLSLPRDARSGLIQASCVAGNTFAASYLMSARGNFPVLEDNKTFAEIVKTSEDSQPKTHFAVWSKLIAPFLQKVPNQIKHLQELQKEDGRELSLVDNLIANFNLCTVDKSNPLSLLCRIASKVAYATAMQVPVDEALQVPEDLNFKSIQTRFNSMLTSEVTQFNERSNGLSAHPHNLAMQSLDVEQVTQFFSTFIKSVVIPKLVLGDSHPLNHTFENRDRLLVDLDNYKAGNLEGEKLILKMYPDAFKLLRSDLTFSEFKKLIRLSVVEPNFALPPEIAPLRSLGEWQTPFEAIEVDGISFRCIKDAEELKRHGYHMNHCVGGYADQLLRGNNAIVVASKNGIDCATYHIDGNDDLTKGHGWFTLIEHKGPNNTAVTAEISDAWSVLSTKLNDPTFSSGLGKMSGETEESKRRKLEIGDKLDHLAGFCLAGEEGRETAMKIYNYYQGQIVLTREDQTKGKVPAHGALSLSRKNGEKVSWLQD